MPNTVEALQLTNAYRAQQNEVRDKALRAITQLWSRLDSNDLDGSFQQVLPLMVVLLAQARQTNADASTLYLATYVGLESGTAPVERQSAGVEPQVSTQGVPLALPLGLGVIETKRAIGQGWTVPSALQRGLARILNYAASETIAAGRVALSNAMKAEPTVDSYRRVVYGTCGGCLALHQKESSANEVLKAHPNCRCVAEPVVKPQLDDKRVKQWQKQPTQSLRKRLQNKSLHPLDRAEITEALERKTGKKVAEAVARPSNKELVASMSEAEQNKAFGDAAADALRAEKIKLEQLAKVEGDSVVERPLQELLPNPESPLTNQQYEALVPKGRATEARRRTTLKALEQTPDGKVLAKTLESFTSGNARNVPIMRTDISKYLAGENLDAGRVRTIENLLGAIRHAPTTDETLYRGLRLEGYVEDILERYPPGKSVDMNLSSFTSSHRVAQNFANGGAGQKGPRTKIANRVRMEITGGPKRGIPVENMSKFASEKEWLSAGRFEVLNSFYEQKTGTVVLRLRQVGMP